MSIPYPAVHGPQTGSAVGTPCLDRGCSKPATCVCAYVDRTPRACGAGCCEDHGRVVADEYFCLRHAGVMAALVVDPMNMLRKPDVDNRAPSLVAWIARAFAPPLEAMLRTIARDHERVISEPLRPIIADDGVGQAWRRSWRLSDGASPRLVVGIEVDEANDEAVLVTVYTDVVRRDTPPWIAARRRGEELPAVEDERRRRIFYQAMLEAVAEGAARQLRLRRLSVPQLRSQSPP